MAILCMIVLHLFCRTGEDVLGRPLLWINQSTPLVFLFGFFAEICVATYSLCAGYAQQHMYEKNTLSFRSNAKRISKLIVNYWIVLVIFCLLGLFFDVEQNIPGSLPDFLKSIVLLHSYNGAWWYLNAYILLLLIPHKLLLLPVKKLNYKLGLLLCLTFDAAWYFFTKIDIIAMLSIENESVSFILQQLINLIGILPFVLAGAFICKGKLFEKLYTFLNKHFSSRWYNPVLIITWIVLFLLTNLLHKAVLTGTVAIINFLLFNLFKKPKSINKVFMFLGKHSTNMWLTHMFFYLYIFKGLVTIVKYPVLMLLFMILLCVVTSYIVFGIQRLLNLIMNKIKKLC